MSNNIVNVVVNVLPAAIPNILQATGAIISQGSTTLTPAVTALPAALGSAPTVGNTLFLSQASDLTAYLTGAQTLNTLTWTTGIVTATDSTGHGYPTGQSISLTIAGNTATGYNGTFICTITSATQFTYAVATNPGTSGGTTVVTDADVASLVNKVSAYFTQSSNGVGIYVIELGVGDSAHGVTALTSFLVANPLVFYILVCPYSWSSDVTFLTLINSYSNNKSMTYFYFDVGSASYTTYKGLKSAVVCALSPLAPSTEKMAAALSAIVLNYAPSMVNKVPQAAYTFLFGLTKWPVNNTNIPSLIADYVNFASSGAEGGLSNTILKMGVYSDGSQLNHWYAIDWCNIQVHQGLANTIILGSNNTINPLYYNQQGIAVLTATAQTIINQAVAFGLIGGAPLVVGIPYLTYTATNPNDYGNGIYNGLYVTVSTQQGFQTITFNLTISNLAP